MTGGGDLITVLGGVFLLIQAGMFASGGIGKSEYVIRRWLSQYNIVDEPDPTINQRVFEKFFEQYFSPVGHAAAEQTAIPAARQMMYHLSISLLVLVLAVVTYLFTAGAIVGGTIAAYYAGFEVNLVPFFELVVAVVVLVGFAILTHAQERASQLPTR